MAAGMRRNAALLVALLIVAVALAPAASGFTVCGVDRTAVDACRSYCAKGSKETSPSDACCAKVKPADWECLCSFKNSLPNDVNASRIMDLQYKCKCDNPPATCGAN
ncbi:hypothetical protein HU200_054294 [Digitaria exilis]|uniref:Bifunctional inhibitor/plant lipid transfer protein/seed storage helical domain-containing protein n=1 Tax=Digitaria exilis TaxID=1010633 RepID=A0A835AN32_9POAL|nr:hypothetical protein HU200_054294 [Digitaria exilis]